MTYAINGLESMAAELDEGVALLQPHYPNESGKQLRVRAMYWRPKRYAIGRWPTVKEIKADKIQEAAKKAAEELAAAKAAAVQAVAKPAE
jgi:hypothetical protein